MNFTLINELYAEFGPKLKAAEAAETERVTKAAALAAAVEADRVATETAAAEASAMTAALDAFVAAIKATEEPPTE